MKRGIFIAFEGGEGAGKSTQARLLAEALAALGIPVELTREPGGTPGSEAIRALLLAPPGAGWSIEAEALLFAAARSDHVAKRIGPALEAGSWVVCDRFVDSSRAYQAVAGGLGEGAVAQLHAIGSGGLFPDLTILLSASNDETETRLRQRDCGTSDAIGGRGGAFHQKVNGAFLGLVAAEPGRFALIDAGGSIETVRERVWAAIEALLPSPLP